MSPTLTHMLDEWMSLYANSAVLRSGIGFAHVAGLIAGGGAAIVADRTTLAAFRSGPQVRTSQLEHLGRTHRTVLGGLVVVIASGLLLLAADLDAYLSSWAFWTKMGLLAVLLLNGGVMVLLARRAGTGDASVWSGLRLTAVLSLVLWLLTTLMGAVLPNV